MVAGLGQGVPDVRLGSGGLPLLAILPIGANPSRARSRARVAAGHHVWRAAPLRVILPGFTLKRREDGPLLQIARLALIVAAPSRCGGRGDASRADAAVARRA